MPTTLEQIAATLARAMEPLASALEGTDADAGTFLEQLGWSLPTVPPAVTALQSATSSVGASLGSLDLALEAEDPNATQPSSAVTQAVVDLAIDVVTFATALHDLPGLLQAQLPANVVAATGIDSQFQERLLHTLVDEQLERSSPLLAASLQLLALREKTNEDADPAKYQPEFVRHTLHFDNLGKLVTDPVGLMGATYGWGTPALNQERLFGALMDLSFALGIPGRFRYPERSLVTALSPGFDFTADGDQPQELVLPLVAALGAGLAVGVMPAPAAAGQPQPLCLTLLVTGALHGDVPLSPRTTLHVDAEADLSSGLSLIIAPGRAPEAHFALGGAGSSPLATGRVGLRLNHGSGDPTLPLRLLTINEGTRVEVGNLYVGVGVDAGGGAPEPSVEAGLEHGRFVLAPTGADSFVSTLLPADGMGADFDLGLVWTRHGLTFRGSAAMDVTLGVHAQIGPLLLESIHLGLAAASDGVSLETSVTGSGSLGPLSVSVDRLGALTKLGFHNGNLGPVDLGLQFKPPNGLGIEVDAGVVKGGGYLFFDSDKHEYAGVLELSLQDVIQIKAIGLLTTRLPDGTPGFSLLIILTAEFPPIQLSFGFTLNGVGGLAGINRTMQVDALRAGLRNHALNSILFPQDPIHNAPQIISDLKAIFPPAAGRYVFGPMLELGWGTPALIKAELGVILEIPAPVRLAILGQIKAALPDEEVPLVQLHIDVLGVVDFAAKQLSIDGTIYDSSILVYSLSGDMALRLDWGNVPSFAVSVGGLHPRFQPPPGFPELRRLTLSLGAGDNPRLACESYMAVTSNSVQFGSRVELYASAAGFTVHGYLGFDVLIIISPFSFEAGMQAGVELLRGGTTLMSIHLDFTLSGPTPWRARGSASFKILFCSISVDFDVSWGDDHQATLPPADARTPLLAALGDSRNWSAALPAGAEQAVSLGPAHDDGTILVHPLGQLEVRQRVAPLDVTISRFGSAPPDHWDNFAVSDVRLNGRVVAHNTVQDRFAAGQFFQLSDEDKLSKPAFEPMDAGLRIGTGTAIQGHDSQLELHYETKIVDDVRRPARLFGALFRPDAVSFAAHAKIGAAALSQVLSTGQRKFVAPGNPGKVDVADVRYVVASTADLIARADVAGLQGMSRIAAEHALASHLSQHPDDAAGLQVLAVHEAVVP